MDANFKEFRYTTDNSNPTCSTGTALVTSPFNVTIPDATTTLKVVTCDLAGNISPVATATYTFDSDPPQSTSISINSAATDTNTSSVTLTLAATGATSMYVSNTAGCGSGGSWETYATSKTGWSLAQNNTTATVYVKFRDAADNESTCTSDTIIHDSTPPNITSGSVTTTSPGASLTANVSFTSNETGTDELFSVSGCLSGSISSSTSMSVGANTATTSTLAANTTTNIWVKATDSAGNFSCTSLGSYRHDDQPPQAPNIVSTPATDSFKNTLQFNFTQSISVTDFRDFRYLLNDSVSVLNCSTGTTATSANTFNINATTIVRVVACDTGGLASPVSAKTFTLDQEPPLLTLAQVEFFSKNNFVTLSGLCETGLNVVISEGATQLSSSACASAAWSYQTPNKTTDGVYTFTIKQTDVATNETSLQATFTRDNVAPNFVLGTGVTASQTTNTNSVTWSGSCETGLAITATKGGVSINGPSCTAGSWSFTDSSVSNGTFNYVLTQTDKASNGTTHNLTWIKDSNVPALALGTGQVTTVVSTASTQTWSGSCTAGIATISVSGAASTTINCTSGSWTYTTPSTTTDGQRTYTLTQTNTIPQAAMLNLIWTRDATAPSISLFQLNSGAATTNRKVVNVNLTASDVTSNILRFCLRVFNASQASPAPVSDCWVDVDAPFPALSPGLTLTMTNYPQLLDFFDSTYWIYAWVQDTAGNSSAVLNRSITLTQAQPPSILGFFAASDDASYQPLAAGKETVNVNSWSYIKWRIADDKAWPAGAVKIFATSDDSTWTEISPAGGLNATAMSGCSVGALGYTGCLAWQNLYYAAYHRYRIEITDSEGLKTNSLSNALNTATFTILAGNISTGIDGDAKRAVFFSDTFTYESMMAPGSFVVNRLGDIYYADHQRGVIKIDSTTNLASIFIKSGSNYAGDGGLASNATVRYPWKLALDHLDRLIIYDYNRIRRVSTNSSSPIIQTIIGEVDSSKPVGDPLNTFLAAMPYKLWWPGEAEPMVVAPNGDIYFRNQLFGAINSPGAREVKVYRSSLPIPIIETITLVGLGDSPTSPNQNIADCALTQFGFKFESGGSLSRIHASTYTDPASITTTSCIRSSHSYTVFPVIFDTNGQKINEYPVLADYPAEHWLGASLFWFTSRTGKLYAASRFHNRIYQYNETPTGSETDLKIIAGFYDADINRAFKGRATDGSDAVGSLLDVKSIYIDHADRVYMFDNETFRTIGSDGKIYTLYGVRINEGNNEAALSARFDKIHSVDYYRDANTQQTKIFALDTSAHRLHEIIPQGNTRNIAGDGFHGMVPNGEQATAVASLRSIIADGIMRNMAVANRNTGELYFNTLDTWMVAKLNLPADRWSTVIGGNASSYGNSFYETSDGVQGSAIRLWRDDAEIRNWQRPAVVGWGENRLLVNLSAAQGSHPSSTLLKVYDTSNSFTQSHLAGKVSTVNPFPAEHFCESGLSKDCMVPINDTAAYVPSYARATFDPVGQKWWVSRQGLTYVTSLGEGATGVVGRENIKVALTSFAYRRSGATEFIYYCGINDGRIYKHTVGQAASTDSALNWPMASMRCQGNGMVYDVNRQRIIFPFTANGLSGVAETSEL